MSKVKVKVCERLYILSSSLIGIGALFQQPNREIPLESPEINGIENLLQKLGEEAQILEDLLQSGSDSTAVDRNGTEQP